MLISSTCSSAASRNSRARKSGPRARSKRAHRVAGRQPPRLVLGIVLRRQVVHGQREGGAGGRAAPAPSSRMGKTVRSEWVAAHELGQHALQRERVERASGCAAASGMLYDGALGLELVEEPEPLLREREREVAVGRAPRDRLQGLALAHPAVHAQGQLGHGGRLEQRAQRQLHRRAPGARGPPRAWPAASARPARRSCRARPPARRFSTSAHTAARRLLGGRCAGDAAQARPRAPRPGAGSAARSSLPLGVSGSASSATKARAPCRRGDARSSAARSSAAVHARPRPPRRRRPPAARSPAPSSRVPTTGAARTDGMRAQRRLDLARLDAEAAHLELVVDAAQELQRAVGAPARPVAGAVHPRAGRGR